MNPNVLYQWSEEIANRFPCLNSWQMANVAQFSLGIIHAQNCQQQKVAQEVAVSERIDSCARRWRRFLDNKRFPLNDFFSEWTRWVVEEIDKNKVVLLVDETKLADRLGAMVVGVAWEGRCIPLAWRCYVANSADDYPQEGQVKMIETLLKSVKRGIDESREVIVLADRGIGTSPDLCRCVAALGWTYLFRITCQCKVCTPEGDFTIGEMVSEGEQWACQGEVFKKKGRLPAKAIALWSTGYEQPWALVTNDLTLTGFEYAQRNWEEQAFRDLKSGGWQWQACRIRHPDHLERLVVLLALAYGWTLALGSQAVRQGRGRSLQKHVDGTLRRYWSLFKEGIQYFFEVIDRSIQFETLKFFPDHRFI